VGGRERAARDQPFGMVDGPVKPGEVAIGV
jgi:hypothetical protein